MSQQQIVQQFLATFQNVNTATDCEFFKKASVCELVYEIIVKRDEFFNHRNPSIQQKNRTVLEPLITPLITELIAMMEDIVVTEGFNKTVLIDFFFKAPRYRSFSVPDKQLQDCRLDQLLTGLLSSIDGWNTAMVEGTYMVRTSAGDRVIYWAGKEDLLEFFSDLYKQYCGGKKVAGVWRYTISTACFDFKQAIYNAKMAPIRQAAELKKSEKVARAAVQATEERLRQVATTKKVVYAAGVNKFAMLSTSSSSE